MLECPRSTSHGEMVKEEYPVLTLRCLICGFEAYPNHLHPTRDDPGSRMKHNRSRALINLHRERIRHFVESGYTNAEISEILELTTSLVAREATIIRAQMRENGFLS